MAWLEGWGLTSKRVRIPLDHNDIDAALTDFTHLIEISASSGYNNKDITYIFDELENNGNRKKIAVTRSDGVTECYVEIERWDHTAELAELWTKIPDVDPAVDTCLYLYYDRNHDDNDAYVGDSSDAVVHNVWDLHHKLVTHMRDDPDTSHVRDSTVNAQDGTKKAANQPIEVNGVIGKAQDYDYNNDDYVRCGGGTISGDGITATHWFRLTDLVTSQRSLNKDNAVRLYIASNGMIYFYVYTDPGGWNNGKGNLFVLHTDHSIDVGEDHRVTLSYDKSDGILRAFVDGAPAGTLDLQTNAPVNQPATMIYLGTQSPTAGNVDGHLDEVRFSDIGISVRTAAWIKATYESERDHLNDFGEVETHPVPPPTGGIPPLILQPPPRRVPFIRRLISFGRIRRPFTREGRLGGIIRRPFLDEVVFTATSVKRIEEVVTLEGAILTDDIPDRAWLALIEARAKEQDRKNGE